MKVQEMTESALEDVIKMLKALADKNRLRIMQRLHGGELSVGAIVEATQCLQANVSKHLKILTEANLVKARKSGTTVYYSISDPCVDEVCESICKGYVKLLKKKWKRMKI